MIYLFNQLEELIDVIDEASLAEFTHTIELNQFDRSSFEIPVDYKPNIIKEAQFFGFQSRDMAFCLFRISEKSYDLGLTIEGIDRAESDLHSFIIEDKRPSGTADQVLRGILEGTGYQLGDTNRLTVNGKMSFYYISVRQALVKIIESYGCEFRVRYTFVENKIIGRYIDLYQRFGRKTGHQFEYGSNILNVTYEESSDEVVTALIGRGKGEQNTDDTGETTGGYGRRIQFKDVAWAIAKGDPVDKPAGQNYVANEAARNNYGLHQNGVIKHRFGVYTNENIEDPVELLKATYKELQRLSIPIVTFKANLLDLANTIEQDIWIGDSVGIVRDQIGIAFEARIHKLVIDKLDDNRSVAELGDYQTLQAKDRTTRQQAIIDAVSGFSESLIEKAIADEVDRRDKEFDEKIRINKLEFDNALESVKAKAEENKQKLSDTIDQRFSSFDNGPLQEAKRRAEEALRNAGASSLLAQEAKRIALDSTAKLEEFKRQSTSAQTALSGDLDVLKRTVANDVRPKQAQAEAEIAKQVEALIQTKNELAGVKSAQATYEEATTRRLAELTNLANGKVSKSELTQTAEELASKIASVQASGRNLFLNSLFKQDISKTGIWTTSTYEATIDSTDKYLGHNALKIVGQNPSGRDGGNPKITYPALGQFGKVIFGSTTNQDVTISFYAKASTNGIMLRSRLGNINYKTGNVILSTEIKRYVVHIPKSWTNESKLTTNEWLFNFNQEGTVWIWMPKFEISDVDTSYSEAPEDIEGQISAVESNFRQRADALDAGVSRLTEGLRTKADISSLNVTAENIRQSVKSLETDTQNKLNQMLSLAEFEVRASSIRQEILNATKDKADKTLVVAEAGKLRTELSTVQDYVNKDGQRKEELQRYTREESARQVNAVREQTSREYVSKSTHQEDVRGIERRFEAITNPQNGTIATQIANYKQSVDGRFADITSLIAGKANQTDFQRVKETSQLYERILGNTNNSIADNIARMAMTSQLFQVEIEKNVGDGRNLLKGSKKFSGSWVNSYTYKRLQENFNDLDVLFKSSEWSGAGQEVFVSSDEIYTFSLWAKSDSDNDFARFYVNKNGSQKIVNPAEKNIKITNEWKRYSFTFVATKDGNVIPRLERFNSKSNIYIAGLKLEKGSYATPYTEAPEDTDEAIRSVQSQLAGSWSVQNLTSAGALVSGLNLGANGHNRLDGKLTHITGETLIDKAVIKSAMVDKLKTANFEAGSVTTVVLDAEAVTAEKIKVDQALFNKLVANEAYLSQLFAKQAFINRVQSVAIDASQIKTGVLTGGRIHGGSITGSSIAGGTITGGTITGGTITGSSISGATLTGHTKIQLGTYGSFDTVDGGLQINVPRTVNSKDGLGVQFIGSYGRGTNVPYGLYIYKDSDLTTNSTALQSDDFIMTVEGYIKAKGIGWFKTDTGSVNGKLTATIGLWNSNNVSLSFGGSGNDIYYSYNGTAYSLWSVVNQHFSDRRLKENIVDCKHKALDYIHQFQFKEYDWKKQEDRPRQAHTKIGLIAQEVQAVDPTLVYENGDTLNLDNLRLTNIALKAIQELSQRIETLERKLA